MSGKSGEFFYLDENGEKQDADLHMEILQGGDHAGARAISRKIAREIGLTELQILKYLHDDPCTQEAEGAVDAASVVKGKDGKFGSTAKEHEASVLSPLEQRTRVASPDDPRFITYGADVEAAMEQLRTKTEDDKC